MVGALVRRPSLAMPVCFALTIGGLPRLGLMFGLYIIEGVGHVMWLSVRNEETTMEDGWRRGTLLHAVERTRIVTVANSSSIGVGAGRRGGSGVGRAAVGCFTLVVKSRISIIALAVRMLEYVGLRDCIIATSGLRRRVSPEIEAPVGWRRIQWLCTSDWTADRGLSRG